MAQAAALTGFGTGARRGNARASRRVVTGRRVHPSDRYYSADPFRRWNDSMPGTRVQTSLLKSPPIISGPIVVAAAAQLLPNLIHHRFCHYEICFIPNYLQFDVSCIEAL